MKYKPYPKYKDSGVEWLGEIPEGWEISKLGFEAWVRARLGWKGLKSEEYVDEGYIFLSTPNIKDRDIDFLNVNYINHERYEESPEIKLKLGDVLLAKDGSTLGTVNIVRELPKQATVNSSIAVISPYQKLNGLFLKYLIDSAFMKAVIQLFRGGMGVPHIFQEDINKFLITLPPLPTQRVIAAFLDAETARIDGLVKDYEELIALLKEKRQALISHAVTRGLSELVSPDDPEFGEWAKPVKFKDSGVEWIGEIPEGWAIIPLKYISRMQSGDFIQAEIIADEGAFPVLGGNGLRGYTENYNIEGCFPLIGRQGALCGNVNFGIGRFWATEHAIVTYPNDGTDSKWLYWTLVVMNLGQYNSSAAQPGIAVEVIKNKVCPVTTLLNQRAIASFLDKETAKIDALVSEAESAIELLKEYRAAIITNAVTGKINVEASA